MPLPWLRIKDLGFWVLGLRFRVEGVGCRARGSGKV